MSPVEWSYANREPDSYYHLGAFYVSCFARVCEFFTAVVSELQRGTHVVLKSLYAATHTIQVYIGAVCLFSCNTDKKTPLWFL